MSDWPGRRERIVRELTQGRDEAALQPWEPPALGETSEEGRCGAVYFAMRDFERHITSETAELQRGLEAAGYELCGKEYKYDSRDVANAAALDCPHTVIVTDQREWDPRWPGCFDPSYGFTGIKELGRMDTVFRGTILKDAWGDHALRYENHRDLNPHFYIHYYDADLMLTMCPWIRREQLVRTWHTVDSEALPEVDYDSKWDRALLSGALGDQFYPLRTRLVRENGRMPLVDVRGHPGYGNKGCDTPAYLEALSRYKVAICTSSSLGLPLRKIIEATAMGCAVITDLPESEHLPYIDGNLYRVPENTSAVSLNEVVQEICEIYDPEAWGPVAAKARHVYDYRRVCAQLARNIETMRCNYKESDYVH